MKEDSYDYFRKPEKDEEQNFCKDSTLIELDEKIIQNLARN